MEQITLKARLRGQDELGKGPAKRIRAAGDVPGVAYGHGREPVSIAVNARELTAAIRAGANVLVDLQIEGLQAEDGTLAIIKDTQRHPITDRYLSVDLQWISLTEKIAVRVPLVLDGTPVGVQEGGFVEHFLREVEITGIATEIPDAIHADVSHLDIGESLHVRDLQVPPEVELAAHPDEVVATVAAPAKPEEEEVPEEEVPIQEEAAGEGQAPKAPAEEDQQPSDRES